MRQSYLSIIVILLFSFFQSCKSGPFNLLKPATPHEQYERKLVSAGLNQSAMGIAWINNSQKSLQNAVAVSLPYRERGYFAADKAQAASFRFRLTRGEKVQVSVSKKSSAGFMLYFDLWDYKMILTQ